MAVVDEIAVKLGIQKGDLKAALLDANADIKTFGAQGKGHVDGLTGAIKETGKAMQTFRQLLAAGGMIEAVRGFYDLAINYAKEHTKDTDDQTEAVRRFGEQIKSTGNIAGKTATQVLGVLNQIGEGFGIAFTMQFQSLDKTLAAIKANEEAERNLLTIEQARIDVKKGMLELDEKIAGAQVKRNTAEFESLDINTRIAALVKGIQEQFVILNSTEVESLKHKQAALQILTWQERLLKDMGTAEKEQAAARKTQRDNEARWRDEDREEAQEVLEFHRMIIAERKAAADELRRKQEEVTAEAKRTDDAFIAGTTSVYRMVDGVATLVEKTKGFIAEWNKFQTSVSGSANYGQMSDAAIRGQIKKQQDLLNSLTSQGVLVRNASMTGDFGSWQSAMLANDQIAQAQLELTRRSTIRSTVSQFGTDAAVMQFGDSAVNRATASQSSDARNQTLLLNSIAQTVNRVFPGQATPIPPIG